MPPVRNDPVDLFSQQLGFLATLPACGSAHAVFSHQAPVISTAWVCNFPYPLRGNRPAPTRIYSHHRSPVSVQLPSLLLLLRALMAPFAILPYSVCSFVIPPRLHNYTTRHKDTAHRYKDGALKESFQMFQRQKGEMLVTSEEQLCFQDKQSYFFFLSPTICNKTRDSGGRKRSFRWLHKEHVDSPASCRPLAQEGCD